MGQVCPGAPGSRAGYRGWGQGASPALPRSKRGACTKGPESDLLGRKCRSPPRPTALRLIRLPSSLARYDIVFLPPSFPIVAMENPCLTFIISSILESDEFLVIDVIHEVAHSWFGNAVTNATWEEMWLSEGLATYAQRRITTETYGTARGQQEAGATKGLRAQPVPQGVVPHHVCVQQSGVGSAPQGLGREAAGTAASNLPSPPPASTVPLSRGCLHLSGDGLPPGCPTQADEAPRRGQPSEQASGQAGARYPVLPGLTSGPTDVTLQGLPATPCFFWLERLWLDPCQGQARCPQP